MMGDVRPYSSQFQTSRGPPATSPAPVLIADAGRSGRSVSHKSMLSRALEKANEAVKLDNDQSFIGSVDAYDCACQLLTQVMHNTESPEEKLKLTNIVSPPLHCP